VNARPGSTTAPRQPTPSASASAEAFPRPSKASRLTFKTPAKPRPCSATTSPGSGGRPGRLSIPTPRTASANASKSASSPPSGTHAAARNLPTARREVWITRSQLDRLAEAIQSRYHALVNLAALTGLRWGELAALRWDDVRLDQPLDDGAVAGPGRLRVLRALSDPQPQRPLPLHGPQDRGWPSNDRTGPAKLHHPAAARPAVQRPAAGLVFTTPGGALGPGGPLAANNFRRAWRRALEQAGLDDGWPEYCGLHFHDLHHSHATWLLALRVPMIAVSNRLGHANPVITMMVYAHLDRHVDRGVLTAEELGLTWRDEKRSDCHSSTEDPVSRSVATHAREPDQRLAARSDRLLEVGSQAGR
jgi:integrase